MKTLEAPVVEGFEPINAYRTLGVNYLRLVSEDGVQLELSEPGIAEVDQNPNVASLIGRMSSFIAEHDGYRDTTAVREAEPCDVLGVASRQPDYHYAMHYSSVYHPHAVPEVMIKAFDFDPTAPLQLNVGAWMHHRLAQRSPNMSSPRQLAMLTSPKSRHQTTIAEYVPGKNLHAADSEIMKSYGMTRAIANETANFVHTRAKDQLLGLLGGLSRLVLNDLRNSRNFILVKDSLPDDPDDILDLGQIAIIDQPKKTLRAQSLYGLLRLMRQPLRI
jgi:hypothetical protein